MTSFLTSLTQDSTGLALLDKPSGITSHDLVDRVRRATGVKRVGHAGTLDPLATGLMIVLIGREFTKMQAQFLKQDKTYLVSADFGYTTDSYDVTGTLTKQASTEEIAKFSLEELIEAMPNFTGEISQVVPAYSAVKRAGKKLYQLARADSDHEKLELPSREVSVNQLNLVNLEDLPVEFVVSQPPSAVLITPFSLAFEVSCSSGTYIRSLIHDLGQKLAVGACVTGLRRTRIGNFRVEDSIPI